MRKINLFSFYFCLLFWIMFLWYSFWLSDWDLVPAIYLWGMMLVCFILGLIGFKDKSGKGSRIRSWLTVIFSGLLACGFFVWSLGNIIISNDLITEAVSPDEKYTVKLYLVNGGATTPYSISGVLDGPLWFEKHIFYDYRQQEVTVNWLDDHTVSINDHVLDLARGETYRYDE